MAMGVTQGRTEPPSDSVVKAVLDLWRECHKAHEVPIRGRSMFPALRSGDVVRVEPNLASIGPGVIVVFRQGGDLIAHRVLRTWQVGQGRRAYLTQGDRCSYSDPPLEADRILGQVVGVWRNGRYRPVGDWRQRWLGWLIAESLRLKTGLRSMLRQPNDAA
jgi:signal peptidase I